MFKNIALLTCSILFSLLFFEATLYAVGLGGVKERLDTPYVSIYGWSSWHGSDHLSKHPHFRQTNQFGFRGHQYDETVDNNVILLGDSQVETSHQLSEMPEVYLKKHLELLTGEKTNVISMGSWGWGTDQQFLALKENIKTIKPKKVVVWFTSNDWTDNVLPEGFVGKKPTFHLLGEDLKGPNYNFGQPFKERSILRLERILENRGLWRWWRVDKNSSFYSRYVSASLNNVKLEKCDASMKQPDLIKDYMVNTRRKVWVDKAKYDKSGVLVKGPAYDEKAFYQNYSNRFINKIGTKDSLFIKYRDGRHPLMQYGINLTRKLLLEIKTLSERHGAEFTAFFVEPPDHAIKSLGIEYCHNGNLYKYSTEAYRKLYKDTFLGIGLTVFDGILPSDYRDDFDGHLNDASNRIVMRELAKILVK